MPMATTRPCKGAQHKPPESDACLANSVCHEEAVPIQKFHFEMKRCCYDFQEQLLSASAVSPGAPCTLHQLPGVTQLQRNVLTARPLAWLTDLSAAQLQLVPGICKVVPTRLELSGIASLWK